MGAFITRYLIRTYPDSCTWACIDGSKTFDHAVYAPMNHTRILDTIRNYIPSLCAYGSNPQYNGMLLDLVV